MAKSMLVLIKTQEQFLRLNKLVTHSLNDIHLSYFTQNFEPFLPLGMKYEPFWVIIKKDIFYIARIQQDFEEKYLSFEEWELVTALEVI